MREWLPFRSAFLAEMIRGAGRGGLESGTCPMCGQNSTLYRCKDCFNMDLICSGCIVRTHANHPLHVIDVRSKATLHLIMSNVADV